MFPGCDLYSRPLVADTIDDLKAECLRVHAGGFYILHDETHSANNHVFFKWPSSHSCLNNKSTVVRGGDAANYCYDSCIPKRQDGPIEAMCQGYSGHLKADQVVIDEGHLVFSYQPNPQLDGMCLLVTGLSGGCCAAG